MMTEWKEGDEVWFWDERGGGERRERVVRLSPFHNVVVETAPGEEEYLRPSDLSRTREECRKRRLRLLRAKANRREKKIEQLHHERAVLLRQIRELEG